MQVYEEGNKIGFNKVRDKSLLKFNAREITAESKFNQTRTKKALNKKVEECHRLSFQSRKSAHAGMEFMGNNGEETYPTRSDDSEEMWYPVKSVQVKKPSDIERKTTFRGDPCDGNTLNVLCCMSIIKETVETKKDNPMGRLKVPIKYTIDKAHNLVTHFVNYKPEYDIAAEALREFTQIALFLQNGNQKQVHLENQRCTSLQEVV